VRPLFQSVGLLDRHIATLSSTRDLLLPRLIAGEIDVTNLDIAMPEAAA
jgi:type I restriction enzyme S subunit